MSGFDPARFEAFCAKLTIDTKEFGPRPLKFMGSQRYAVEQIALGLSQDIHEFVILKGRQLGISTVFLAFDLYWEFKYEGLQGAVVTDNGENLDLFRSYLTQYVESLPRASRPAIKSHNRNGCVFGNKSRLVYMVAGEKKKGGLGRAKGLNMLHATECSSWGDEEGFASLMNSLAQINPNRLYVFESTARGFNMFYQTWETAKKSKTQMAIFVGWWRNELYSWGADTIEYKTYWDGAPSSDERVWIGEVFERYQFEISPNQLAWWRWYCAEKMKGDEMMALQEMPPTEDYAFQLSGSKYFSAERVNIAYKNAMKQPCLYYRYEFGLNFEDTQFLEATEETAEVIIWEIPLKASNEKGNRPGGSYVAGADPAYGSNEWADEHALCILRCYADRVEQVLEAGCTSWTDQQFAWVLAHLCGWYSRLTSGAMLNLEIQGPGGAVYTELGNLKKQAGMMLPGDPRMEAFNVVGCIRDYLYARPDTLNANFAYHWQTNTKTKETMMSTLRSNWERQVIAVNSPVCIQQFRNIHRKDGVIGGEGRAKDDRVIALAIAHIAWVHWIMLELQGYGRTYQAEHRPDEQVKQFHAAERSVINYLNAQKIKLPGLN